MGLSIRRTRAVLIKESKQVMRDPVILAMSVVIPLIQVVIFSFAINTNPKNLPAYFFDFDQSRASGAMIESIINTGYFSAMKPPKQYAKALDDLAQNKVKFIFVIPLNYDNKTASPEPIHIIADASDGISAPGALSALNGLLLSKQDSPWLFHVKYNPRGITRYTVVPGLTGVILLFTIAMLTAVSVVRERERGTMEILLSTPMRPSELMFGKILPYILIGYVQITVVILLSIFCLGIPFKGSVVLLYISSLPYIAANIALGLLISTLARNELQASMGTSFFMLPSILLSGFMYPVAGMPLWAQYVSALLPLHHYVELCRGIMLKGMTFTMIWGSLWPMLLFFVVVMSLAISRFKTTVD